MFSKFMEMKHCVKMGQTSTFQRNRFVCFKKKKTEPHHIVIGGIEMEHLAKMGQDF